MVDREFSKVLTEQIDMTKEILKAPLAITETIYIFASLANDIVKIPVSVGENLKEIMEVMKPEVL